MTLSELGFEQRRVGYWHSDKLGSIMTDNDRKTFSAFVLPYACHMTILVSEATGKPICFRTALGAAKALLRKDGVPMTTVKPGA